MQRTLPDFDLLLDLAQNDPESLERLRRDLTNQVINSAPERIKKRLHGLQFQIDAKVRTAGCPLSACMKISEMMHESFDSLRFVLNNLAGQDDLMTTAIPIEEPKINAKVLPFKQ